MKQAAKPLRRGYSKTETEPFVRQLLADCSHPQHGQDAREQLELTCPWVLTGTDYVDWLEENAHRFMRTPKQIFEGANLDFGAAPSEPGIYFLVDPVGGIFYCGQSQQISFRLHEHLRARWPYDPRPVAWYAITGVPTDALEEIEAVYIRAFEFEQNAHPGWMRHLHWAVDQIKAGAEPPDIKAPARGSVPQVPNN